MWEFDFYSPLQIIFSLAVVLLELACYQLHCHNDKIFNVLIFLLDKLHLQAMNILQLIPPAYYHSWMKSHDGCDKMLCYINEHHILMAEIATNENSCANLFIK